MIDARRFSQLLALSLAALMLWFLVDAARPEPDIFAIFSALMFAFVAILFAASFFALRLGSRGSDTYWRMLAPQQVGRIIALIAVLLGSQLVVGAIVDALGLLDPLASRALGLLFWTLVPAAFLQFGLVQWPTRLAKASRSRVLLLGGSAVILALGYTYVAFSLAGSQLAISSPGPLAILLWALVIAAVGEEVVFRVLLLTALADQATSRFQAVFLSGLLFAALHAPFHLTLPLIHGDWLALVSAVQAYVPIFLAQVFLGLVLGILWLRTGSITLIAVVHAIMNVAPMLTQGV